MKLLKMKPCFDPILWFLIINFTGSIACENRNFQVPDDGYRIVLRKHGKFLFQLINISIFSKRSWEQLRREVLRMAVIISFLTQSSRNPYLRIIYFAWSINNRKHLKLYAKCMTKRQVYYINLNYMYTTYKTSDLI